MRTGFQYGRQLDRGNPNPSTLATDFGRFGVDLWAELERADPVSTKPRNKQLDLLNHWRNAITHQDFNKKELNGATTFKLKTAKGWRMVCEQVARGSTT